MEKEIIGQEAPADNDYQGARVRLCKDGKYRWKYEMNMLTNPTIFWTVYKIFFYIIVIGFAVFGFFIYVIHGNWAGLWGMAKGILIALGGFAVLTFLGVLVVAIMYKGKYIVRFEMDEEKVVHTQDPRQFKKAQKMAAATSMAGAVGGNLTTAGAGMLAATKNASISEFSKVRKVKPRRRLHLIKVNMLIEKNQVYVTDEDFDFVYNFIKSRCPKLKKSK